MNNYYFNEEVARIKIKYECEILDETGMVTERQSFYDYKKAKEWVESRVMKRREYESN